VGGKSVAYNIPASIAALQGKTGKGVIVTEEGWPSCGDNPKTQDKTIAAETDYYHAWLNRHQNPPVDSFDSYYFAAYDNPQGWADANNNFGLCLATGKTKSAGLNCP
jgi:exo-beta-1,3-glucanase (GH17 family)